MNFKKQFHEGLLTKNPVTVQLLGMCSTLAITTSLFNGIGMGAAVTIITICSNVLISALRKVIPSQIRIAAYIVIIAGFVTIVDLLLQALLPETKVLWVVELDGSKLDQDTTVITVDGSKADYAAMEKYLRWLPALEQVVPIDQGIFLHEGPDLLGADGSDGAVHIPQGLLGRDDNCRRLRRHIRAPFAARVNSNHAGISSETAACI